MILKTGWGNDVIDSLQANRSTEKLRFINLKIDDEGINLSIAFHFAFSFLTKEDRLIPIRLYF